MERSTWSPARAARSPTHDAGVARVGQISHKESLNLHPPQPFSLSMQSSDWRLFTVLALALLPAVADAGEDPTSTPPGAKELTIRGVVRAPNGRPISWVRLVANGDLDCTPPDGTFAFDGLAHGRVRIDVWLYGVPGAGPEPERVVWAEAGDQKLVIVIDPGDELIVRAQGATSPRSASDCTPSTSSRLYIHDGQKFKWWGAAVEDGALRFRRIRQNRPWTLWIPWSRHLNGTAFRTGGSLQSGSLTVALEHGARITGKVVMTCPNLEFEDRNGTGAPISGVLARRGPVRVQGWMKRDGTIWLPPLPKGTWKIVAYFKCIVDEDLRYMLGTRHAEAGGTVSLVPRPVTHNEWIQATAD